MDSLETARLLCASGETLEAQITLEAALRDHGDDARLRVAYAAILLQVGDWQGGLDQLEQVRGTAPWDPVVEAYVAGALLGLNRVNDAKDTLDAAFERAPDNFYVLLKRGELYCRLGIYSVAVDTLERAQKVGLDDAIVREAVRRLLRFARSKHQTGFVRYVPRASRIGPVFADLRAMLRSITTLRPTHLRRAVR